MGRARTSGVYVKIRERDLGMAAILKALKAPGREIHLKVGVVGPDATSPHDSESGLTNAELAMIHEFGAPGAGIPERSFIRSTMDAGRSEYLNVLMPKVLRAVLDRRISIYQAFELVGQRMSADVKKRITAGESIPPPLAEETVKRKGSSRSLVDTGRLVASITYAVVLGALGHER